MKIRIARDVWLPAIQMALGAVDRKQAVPILGNVLVRARSGEVSLWGTDLEVEVMTSVQADVQQEGATTIPARKLWEIWRNLPTGATAELSASSGRAVFRTGSTRFTLSTLEADAFPLAQEVEPVVAFRLPAERLKELLERSHFAMAQQDVRYYLNGLLLEVSSARLRAVATDGHRLACCDAPVEIDVGEGETHQAIVPRKGVLELLRLGAAEGVEAKVEVGAQALQATIGSVRITSRLVEARFPEYERVIPDPAVWDKHMVAAREDLRQGLVRASVLANERYRAVRLSLSRGRVRLQAENAEKEEAEEELEVAYVGEPVEIGFNVTYLVDALSAVRTDQVRVCLNDEGSSALILAEGGDGGCRYVVMPMRL